MDDSILQLGGNIELSGFSSLDNGSMVILKKIIGNYARRMNTQTSNFEKLSLTMKTIHNNQFEINAKFLDNGQQANSKAVERNIFAAVDDALKKIMNRMN